MLRVALVGAGGMGSVHAGCYASISDAKIAGVFDIRSEQAAGLAGQHGAKSFADFDGMLTETRPDVIVSRCQLREVLTMVDWVVPEAEQ